MVHPFDIELGDDGRLYVSCQDTNTVVALHLETRKPTPVATHLSKKFPAGNFLPGTLVASTQGHLPEVGDPIPGDVPSPQGLNVVLDVHGRPRHSVRGIIVHRRLLYVADEAGDAVKIFEVKSGRFVAQITGNKLRKPVHLFLHGKTLFIGAAGTGSILAYKIPKRIPRGKLRARTVIDRKLHAPSGFAVGPEGDLYVAERFHQRVCRFSVKGKMKKTFIEHLPDMPEFLVHVPDLPILSSKKENVSQEDHSRSAILNIGGVEMSTRRLIALLENTDKSPIFSADLAPRIGFIRKRFPREDDAHSCRLQPASPVEQQ